MANPSGRSFRVIDTTHLAAVAVLEAEIGAGNELVERPEMADSSDLPGKYFRQPFRRYGVVSDIYQVQQIPLRPDASFIPKVRVASPMSFFHEVIIQL